MPGVCIKERIISKHFMGWFERKDKWKMTDSERQAQFYKEWLLSGLFLIIIIAVGYGVYSLFIA